MPPAKEYLTVEKILIAAATLVLVVVGWVQSYVVTSLQRHEQDIDDVENRLIVVEQRMKIDR